MESSLHTIVIDTAILNPFFALCSYDTGQHDPTRDVLFGVSFRFNVALKFAYSYCPWNKTEPRLRPECPLEEGGRCGSIAVNVEALTVLGPLGSRSPDSFFIETRVRHN